MAPLKNIVDIGACGWNSTIFTSIIIFNSFCYRSWIKNDVLFQQENACLHDVQAS